MRKKYKPSIPRTALALISIATAVVTMGAMVVLPASLEFVDGDQDSLATASATPIAIVSREIEQCADEPQADSRKHNLDRRISTTRVAAREPR